MSVIDTFTLMSAPGGPGGHPPGAAHTCRRVSPMKFTGRVFASGVPTVRNGDFGAGVQDG
jgi:hypothetical protein